jgi:hypothetical protein
MISLVQVVAIIFGVFAFSRAVLGWKEKKIRLAELIFWAGVWLFAIISAISPQILSLFSNVLGFKRGLDFILAISIIVLFYMIFRLYVMLDIVDQNLTRLVRDITITQKTKGKK